MKPKTVTFAVKVNMPEDCSIERLRLHVKEAVECWGGQRHPADPLFDLRGVSVKLDKEKSGK